MNKRIITSHQRFPLLLMQSANNKKPTRFKLRQTIKYKCDTSNCMWESGVEKISAIAHSNSNEKKEEKKKSYSQFIGNLFKTIIVEKKNQQEKNLFYYAFRLFASRYMASIMEIALTAISPVALTRCNKNENDQKNRTALLVGLIQSHRIWWQSATQRGKNIRVFTMKVFLFQLC